VTRAYPVASRAEAGDITIVSAAWNSALLDELEVFPQVDTMTRSMPSPPPSPCMTRDPRSRLAALRSRRPTGTSRRTSPWRRWPRDDRLGALRGRSR